MLVIDDDPAVRELMKRFLRGEGMRIVAAAGGEEGLRLARELKPAAITLDVMMPVMDGFELVVVMTAKTLTDEDRRRLNGSVRAIVQKAGSARDTFLAEVRELLAASIRRQRPEYPAGGAHRGTR